MEAPNDRLIRYLQDAHAAELGIADMIESFVEEAKSNEMASMLFRDHLAVTRTQISRLEQRLEQLGSKPSGSKGFFNTLMSKVGDMLQGAHDEYDKVTQDLIKAYATEHFEQGMYSSLIAYAEVCGDEETAMLAEEILCEEEEAALKIFPMIEVCAVQTYDAAIRQTSSD